MRRILDAIRKGLIARHRVSNDLLDAVGELAVR